MAGKRLFKKVCGAVQMIGKIECGVAVERRAVLHIQCLGQQLIETAGSRVTDPVYGFFGSGSCRSLWASIRPAASIFSKW